MLKVAELLERLKDDIRFVNLELQSRKLEEWLDKLEVIMDLLGDEDESN